MNKRLDEIKELYSKKYMTKLYLRSSITDLLSYIEKLERISESAQRVKDTWEQFSTGYLRRNHRGFRSEWLEDKELGCHEHALNVLEDALSSLDAPATKEKAEVKP